jgi:hypothetical protein
VRRNLTGSRKMKSINKKLRKEIYLNRNIFVDNYIYNLNPVIQKLVISLREIILGTSKDLREEIKWGIPFYSYKGILCYLNPSRTYVTLGFSHGAELPNLYRLLEGNGKEVRYIKIKSKNEIQRKIIRTIIREAMINNELKITARKSMPLIEK